MPDPLCPQPGHWGETVHLLSHLVQCVTTNRKLGETATHAPPQTSASACPQSASYSARYPACRKRMVG
eukprot:34815-Chlamydomonas_euryale.AAC.1